MVTLLKKLILIQVFLLVSIMGYSVTIISSANSNNVISGGTINWSDDTYIVIDNVYIMPTGTLNITPSSGSITIYVDPGIFFDVRGTINANGTSAYSITFTENQSGYGWAGIGISSNTFQNRFTYCTFECVLKTPTPCSGNFLSQGAVYLNSCSNSSFDYCTFQYNETCSGAGFASTSSKVMLSNCVFSLNTATEIGGGIYIDNASSGSYIQDCGLEQNVATNGGGIYLDNTSNSITMSGNELNLNEADNGAGAYFTNLTLSGFVFFTDNSFSSNIATNNGGGIFITSSTIDNMDYSFFRQNEAENGAGIFINQSIITSLGYSLFEGNEAASNGGGIHLFESYANVIMNRINVNHSGSDGGGVFIGGVHPGGNHNAIINCEISGSSAGNNGGGIYTNYSFDGYSNTIADNAAISVGGGIYHDGCSSTISNTIIWDNTANTFDESYPDPDGNNGYSYCCTPSFTNCASCTSGDPNFIGSGNYMISYLPNATTKASSCYNKGDNNATIITSIDLAGNARRNFSEQIDIGAYEDPYFYGDICYYSSGSTSASWYNRQSGTDFIISGPIEIPASCSCSISSATSIAFYEETYLDVKGSLTAIGTDLSTNSVTFTATVPNDGWDGIRFGGDATNTYGGTSYLTYCDISHVNKDETPAMYTAKKTDWSGGIFINGNSSTNILIDHCKIHNNIVASHGGGILCFDCPNGVIIQYCEIYDNWAKIKGGGISLKGESSTIIRYNDIYDNNANIGGGGIWICADGSEPATPPYVFHNNIYSNEMLGSFLGGTASSHSGGGIGMSASNAIIDDNTIYDNKSYYGTYSGSPWFGLGGGISCSNPIGYTLTIEAKIKNNTLYENEAVWGGGVSLKYADAIVFNNFIYNDNNSSSNGGGIYILSDNTYTSEPILYNNLITNNFADGNGGGIYINISNPKTYNCTIADNEADGDGDGVFFDPSYSTPLFHNTIIYYNNGDDVDENGSDPNPQTGPYNYCFIEDFDYPYNSGSNKNGIPEFRDHSNGDYRISCEFGSPCIDAGDNTYYNSILSTYSSYDVRNNILNPRVVDADNNSTATIDIGAYEYEYSDCYGGGYSYKIAPGDSIESVIVDDGIVISPNPAEKWFSFQIYAESNEDADVYIINSVGEIVLERYYLLTEGNNNFYLERDQLKSGMYFLKINSKSIKSKTLKLILK